MVNMTQFTFKNLRIHYQQWYLNALSVVTSINPTSNQWLEKAGNPKVFCGAGDARPGKVRIETFALRHKIR